jgi:hypothetical protein
MIELILRLVVRGSPPCSAAAGLDYVAMAVPYAKADVLTIPAKNLIL